MLSPLKNLQDHPTHFIISGEVRNARNEKAIPYSTIAVPGKSTGTLSNIEGKFQISIPVNTDIDSIQVSCIGYKQQDFKINDLITGTGIIRLEPYKFQIDELIIRPHDPHKLILSVLENKDNNYPKRPEMLSAFFRETAKQDNKYIGLTEAIIDIYKTSYLNHQNDKIRLDKGRHGSNVEDPELINLVVEGSLYNNLQLDIMKYGVSFLDQDYFDNYEYEFKKQITYNHKPTYLIGFYFLNNNDQAGFNGTVYIDAESTAIVRAEFEFSPESLKHAYALLIRKTPSGFRITPRVARYEVEYRKYNQNWNLNYARSEVIIRVKKKRGKKNKGFNCLLSASSEFVITGKTEANFEKIRYRDASKPDDILYQQVSETNDDFWNTQNIILPEEPLLETIRKLQLDSTRINGQFVKSGQE